MAKVKSPLFGIEASGQIGNTVVFATWKGIKYARKHVIPSNPRTAAQTSTRNVFKWLNTLYKYLPTVAQEPWREYARKRTYTDRNAHIGVNLPLLRNETSIANYVGSPGTGGAPAPTDLILTPDAVNLEITAELQGATPQGWTISAATFVLLEDQDPHADLQGQPQAQQATASPWQVTFTGLESGKTYVVTAWFKYTKPDGTAAYGTSQTKTATV